MPDERRRVGSAPSASAAAAARRRRPPRRRRGRRSRPRSRSAGPRSARGRACGDPACTASATRRVSPRRGQRGGRDACSASASAPAPQSREPGPAVTCRPARTPCAPAGGRRGRPGYRAASARVVLRPAGVERVGDQSPSSERAPLSRSSSYAGRVRKSAKSSASATCSNSSRASSNCRGRRLVADAAGSRRVSSSSTPRTSSAVTVVPCPARTPLCIHCQICDREISAVAASSIRLWIADRAVAAQPGLQVPQRRRRRCRAARPR